MSPPRLRASAALAVVAACAACATVAGVEVTRPPNDVEADGDDDAIGDASVDAKPDDATGLPEADGDASAAPIACGCDAGAACCVRSASSTCVARDPGACTDPGSFHLGCVRPDHDGRECCWNEDGGLHATAFGTSCRPARAACLIDGDCLPYGGTCFTRTCAGTTFGICAASDAAVPPELVCP